MWLKLKKRRLLIWLLFELRLFSSLKFSKLAGGNVCGIGGGDIDEDDEEDVDSEDDDEELKWILWLSYIVGMVSNCS